MGLNYTFVPRIGSRLDIFYRGKFATVSHCADNKYFTIKKIPYGNKSQIVAVVHLPSKMYSSDGENAEILQEMLNAINKVKKRRHINKVVIVGDFNMNPYELPMIEATALQAISSRDIVIRRKQRKYNNKDREFYYNPMWNFLGDEKFPVGSYYYSSPQNKAMYWNTFDQFIVNEELASEVALDKIKIMQNIDTIPLANKNGEPIVSDHFPLYFEIGETK